MPPAYLDSSNSCRLKLIVYGGRGRNQFELFPKYPPTLKYYQQCRLLYIKKYH